MRGHHFNWMDAKSTQLGWGGMCPKGMPPRARAPRACLGAKKGGHRGACPHILNFQIFLELDSIKKRPLYALQILLIILQSSPTPALATHHQQTCHNPWNWKQQPFRQLVGNLSYNPPPLGFFPANNMGNTIKAFWSAKRSTKAPTGRTSNAATATRSWTTGPELRGSSVI